MVAHFIKHFFHWVLRHKRCSTTLSVIYFKRYVTESPSIDLENRVQGALVQTEAGRG